MADPRIRMDLTAARLNLKCVQAQMQRFATSLAADHGSDWEERYVAGGVSEMENLANDAKR